MTRGKKKIKALKPRDNSRALLLLCSCFLPPFPLASTLSPFNHPTAMIIWLIIYPPRAGRVVAADTSRRTSRSNFCFLWTFVCCFFHGNGKLGVAGFSMTIFRCVALRICDRNILRNWKIILRVVKWGLIYKLLKLHFSCEPALLIIFQLFPNIPRFHTSCSFQIS